MINAICYTTYCCVQASLALLFIEIYHFKEIQAGLVYLPFGCGCVIASLVSGKIMDRDYRAVAKMYNFPVDRVKGDDLSKFRIERARPRSSWYFLGITIVCVAGYGWALSYQVNIAVVLVLQFFIGAAITCLFNMCGTLLTDLNPHNPALAQASSNIVEYRQMCSFGGGAGGSTGDDQSYWTGMDLHCVCGFMPVDCADGCGGGSVGLCVAFHGSAGY
ncbi:hypothetical protein XPA_009737 [Xanthoria parietina]